MQKNDPTITYNHMQDEVTQINSTYHTGKDKFEKILLICEFALIFIMFFTMLALIV